MNGLKALVRRLSAVSGAGTGLLVRDRDEFVQQIRDLMYDSARRGALGAAALGLAGGLRDANPAHRSA